jgi:hypothetical protein
VNADWLRLLHQKYADSGVFIDSNLLLVLLVGEFDRERVDTFKRTKHLGSEGYDTLVKFLGAFQRKVTCPHVLTEVSNLASNLYDEDLIRFFEAFAQYAANTYEISLRSSDAVRRPELSSLGLTDTVILSEAVGKYLVLTDDFRLAAKVNKAKGDAVNFNHIQEMNWGV